MMNLNFCASTGVWTDDNGNVVVPEGHSWSGNDSNPEVNPLKLHGKLNTGNVVMPDGSVVPAQSLHKIGALPCGVYSVGEWGDWSTVAGYPKRLGPLIARLTQTSGATYGRDGMFIHGPSGGAEYGQESWGCIVTLHADRQKVALLNPTTVTVTA